MRRGEEELLKWLPSFSVHQSPEGFVTWEAGLLALGLGPICTKYKSGDSGSRGLEKFLQPLLL